MRLILILVTIMAQPFLAGISLAQTDSYDDCKQSCVEDRGERDADCPSPYDSPSANQERDQCLKASRDTYSSCIRSCQPSSPSSSPAEPSTPPMGGY